MGHLNERLPIFTERFRELKGERNDTEFAEFLGISRQTVGFFGNGNRLPDAVTLVKISQKCGVSADWLLGISNVKILDAELKQVCEYTGLSEHSIKNVRSFCLLSSMDSQIAFNAAFFVNKILESPDLYKSMIFAFDAVEALFIKKHNIHDLVKQKEDKSQADQEFLEESNKFISDAQDMLEKYGKVIINAEQAEEYCLIKAREYLYSVITSAFEDMAEDIRKRIESKLLEK